MDLNLSNRGLFSFDAAQARLSLLKTSQHTQRTSGASATSVEDALNLAAAAPSAAATALPLIRHLNLSFNSLHIFTGGETLRGLAVLDLSHNELAQLHTHALPSTLLKLNLCHNRLAQLVQLVDSTPQLQELDVSHNQLSASALRGLPVTLTRLNVESNAIESLTSFSTLLHLVKLNVAQNALESSDALQSLRPLLSLRFLDLRGNPLWDSTEYGSRSQSDDTSRKSNSSVDEVSTGRRQEQQQRLVGILNSVVPRLSHLNGVALSQAPENRMLKSGRRAPEAIKQGRSSSSKKRDTREGKEKTGVSAADKSNLSTSRDASAMRPALEIRLMQAKVNELRRLLLAAQDAEGKARQERALLAENVKSTALVIDQQGAELEKLQDEMVQLREEERLLRVPIAAVEESFEQVHASLLATKVKAGVANLK